MRVIESIDMIYRDPDVRGGRPCIVGTGLRVMDVIGAARYGNRSAEEIAAGYKLSLSKVYAAFAYYHLNKAEIDADIQEHIETGDQLKAEGYEQIAPPIHA